MTFNSAEEKYTYVNNMFGRIAQRYDVMNRVMTLGQDIRWRKLLVKAAQLPPQGGRILDLATGTGDIAFEVLKQRPQNDVVVGADYTLPMMAVGRERKRGQGVRWAGADALNLPFPVNYFDVVASGFLMRNVVDVRRAIIEQVRVCKPGGRIIILEIPRPADTVFGNLFRFYFHNIVPVLGGLISGERDAYTYLPASADAFLRPVDLKAEMEEQGLGQVTFRIVDVSYGSLARWGKGIGV